MRALARRPVTILLTAVVLLANVAAGTVVHPPAPGIRNTLGLGAEDLLLGHDLISLITSVVLTTGPAELVVMLLAILVVVGLAEPRLGSRRTALALVTAGVGGGLLGTAAQAAGLLTHGAWSTPPADLVEFHPFTPVVGTAMAASSFVGPLWRRRIRVLGFAGLLVVLLYSGQPGDLYRLAGALVGLVLGVLLSRKRPTLVWQRSSHHEARTLLTVLVGIGATGPVLAVFQRTGYGLLRPLGILFRNPLPLPAQIHGACLGSRSSPGCVREVLLGRLNSPGTVVLDLLPLLVLVGAAISMLYGRRAGAWAAILVNGLLSLLAALYYNLFPSLVDPDQFVVGSRGAPSLQTFLAVLIPLALAALVVANLPHFTERTARRAFLASAATVAGIVLVGAAAYVTVGLTSPGSFTPHVSAFDLLTDLPERYVPVGFLRLRRLDFAPTAPLPAFLSAWIGPAAWAALLLATVVCSVAIGRPRSAADESRIRALLRQASAGSISFMATWAGNRYWFAQGGRHAVAYREGSGVALTVGEPIGPRDGAVEAARAFAIACDDRGLIPAFYAVRPSFAAQLGGTARWATAEIGEDTVIHPATFSMKGKRWQDVRSSINRADRLGLHAVWTDWESLSLTSRAQVEAISEEWIADRRLPELGFTLGGLEELRDRDVKLMLAVGPGDHIEAVTSWLPTWRDDAIVGWTLEFMRRRPQSMNGVMEFLIASVVGGAQQRGLDFVSLSVAPLTRSSPDVDANRVERILEALGRILEPVYGFTSLAAFKDKFQPTLVPLVLAYSDAVSLPPISIALARAYLPGLGLPAIARIVGALVPDQGAPPREAERPPSRVPGEREDPPAVLVEAGVRPPESEVTDRRPVEPPPPGEPVEPPARRRGA